MKIFGFVKKVSFVGLTILSNFTNASSLIAISLSFISMNNQPCKARPEIELNIELIVFTMTKLI